MPKRTCSNSRCNTRFHDDAKYGFAGTCPVCQNLPIKVANTFMEHAATQAVTRTPIFMMDAARMAGGEHLGI